MALRLWDPYKVLNITGRNKGWMHCVGHISSHDGARCRWKITSNNFTEVISILGMMEATPPTEISARALLRLAQFSLCEDYHRNQMGRIINEWGEEMMAPAREYGNLENWKKRSKELYGINRTLLAQLEEAAKREANKDSEAQTYVNEVSDRLEQQLRSERQTFETCRRDAESPQRRQVTVETALRSNLAKLRTPRLNWKKMLGG